jgi:hypothetical protein
VQTLTKEYSFNLERTPPGNTFHEVIFQIIATIISIALLVNLHDNGFLPLVRDVYLTPERINELMDLRA